VPGGISTTNRLNPVIPNSARNLLVAITLLLTATFSANAQGTLTYTTIYDDSPVDMIILGTSIEISHTNVYIGANPLWLIIKTAVITGNITSIDEYVFSSSIFLGSRHHNHP